MLYIGSDYSPKKKLFYQASQKKKLFRKLFWNDSMFLSLILDYDIDMSDLCGSTLVRYCSLCGRQEIITAYRYSAC